MREFQACSRGLRVVLAAVAGLLSTALPACAQTLFGIASVTANSDRQPVAVTDNGEVILQLAPFSSGQPMSSVNGVHDYDAKVQRVFFVGVRQGSPTLFLYEAGPGIGPFSSHVLTNGDDDFIELVALGYDEGEQILYGLALVTGGDRRLATISYLYPTAGQVQLLGSPVAGESLLVEGGVDAMDDAGNRLFFVGTPESTATPTLYALSTLDGSLLIEQPITGGATSIAGLEWDPFEQVLYALANVGSDRQLATISEAGVVSLLGNPIAGVSLPTTSGADALDPVGNRYFFVGEPAGGQVLYTISTVNGRVLRTGSVSSADPDFQVLLGLEYNPLATIFIDGLESGSVSAWSSSTP
jgi:hypothetical protein